MCPVKTRTNRGVRHLEQKLARIGRIRAALERLEAGM